MEFGSNVSKLRDLLVRFTPSLTRGEIEELSTIPDELLYPFMEYFGSGSSGDNKEENSLKTAEAIIKGRLTDLDYSDVDAALKSIAGYEQSVDMFSEAILSGEKVLITTDIDNDGSIGYAVSLQLLRGLGAYAENIDIQYIDARSDSRTFTVNQVVEWAKKWEVNQDDSFTVITIDHGTSSLVEQENLLAVFPNVKFIVTDHHLQDPATPALEGEKAVVFNPKHNPTNDIFHKGNISGAHTFAILAEAILHKISLGKKIISKKEFNEHIRVIKSLSYTANDADYVDAPIHLRNNQIKFQKDMASLASSLNVVNRMSWALKRMSSDDISKFKKVYGERTSDFVDLVNQFKGVNVLAGVLMDVINNYEASLNDPYWDTININLAISDRLNGFAGDYKKTDFASYNHLSEFRPFSYLYSSRDNLNKFEKTIQSKIDSVIKSARAIERKIVDIVSQENLVNFTSSGYATIAHSSEQFVDNMFSRHFLRYCFIESNRFMVFTNSLGSGDKTRITGSGRYADGISNILERSDRWLSDHGLSITCRGHDKASGFTLETTDGRNITVQDIENFTQYADSKIEKIINRYGNSEGIAFRVSPSGAPLLGAALSVLRATHNNGADTPNILLDVPKNTSFTVHGDDGSRIVTLRDLGKSDEKGRYVSLNLALDRDAAGSTIIFPVSLIKEMEERSTNHNKYPLVRISFMGGAYMAVCIEEKEYKSKNTHFIDGTRSNMKPIFDAHKENFANKEDNFVKNVPREILKTLTPYHTHTNFLSFEKSIISILDENNKDSFCVVDTEGTGFGLAPILFNVGAMYYYISEDSGMLIDSQKTLKSTDGSALIYVSDLGKIKPVQDLSRLNTQYIKDNVFNLNGELYDISGLKQEDYKVISNIMYTEDGYAVINREIEAVALAAMLKGDGVKVPQDIANLTNIRTADCNRDGISIRRFKDIMEDVTDRLGDCIFCAHNSNYDTGIFAANSAELFNILLKGKNTIIDSASFSKSEQLGFYGSMMVGFAGSNKGASAVRFQDTIDGRDSLFEFIAKGKDGRFGAINPNYFYVIENKNHYVLNDVTGDKHRVNTPLNELILEAKEILLDKRSGKSLHTLESSPEVINYIGFKDEPMPLQRTKYSIQWLADLSHTLHIIDQTTDKVKLPDLKEIIKNSPRMKLIEKETAQFVIGFDLSKSLDVNISNFFRSIGEDWKNEKVSIEEANSALTRVGQMIIIKNIKTASAYNKATMLSKTINEISIGEKTKEQLSAIADRFGITDKMMKDFYDMTVKYRKDNDLDFDTPIGVIEEHNNLDYNGDFAIEFCYSLDILHRSLENKYCDKETLMNLNQNIGVSEIGAFTQALVKTDFQNHPINGTIRGVLENPALKDSIYVQRAKEQKSRLFNLKDSLLPVGASLKVNLSNKELIDNNSITEITEHLAILAMCEHLGISGDEDLSLEASEDIYTDGINKSMIKVREKSIEKLRSLNVESVCFSRVKHNFDDVIKAIRETWISKADKSKPIMSRTKVTYGGESDIALARLINKTLADKMEGKYTKEEITKCFLAVEENVIKQYETKLDTSLEVDSGDLLDMGIIGFNYNKKDVSDILSNASLHFFSDLVPEELRCTIKDKSFSDKISQSIELKKAHDSPKLVAKAKPVGFSKP